MTDDDMLGRRATALESATTQTDRLDPAEQAMAERVRGMLAHPAIWADPPDLPVHPAALHTPAHTTTTPTSTPAPRRGWRRRWALAAGAVATGLAAAALAVTLLARPHHETIRFALTGTEQDPPAHASVTATKLDAGWHLTLHTDHLPGAPPGTYYQGWVIHNNDYVPLGTFHLRQPGEVELWAGVPVDQYNRIEITRQQIGGPQTPGEPVLTGTIPNNKPN